MKIFLSPTAEKKLILLSDFLIEKWGMNARNKFFSKQPKSCIQSEKFPNLFKCVVTKQTSFFYRILENEIEIITVFDTRQNPDELVKEINNLD